VSAVIEAESDIHTFLIRSVLAASLWDAAPIHSTESAQRVGKSVGKVTTGSPQSRDSAETAWDIHSTVAWLMSCWETVIQQLIIWLKFASASKKDWMSQNPKSDVITYSLQAQNESGWVPCSWTSSNWGTLNSNGLPSNQSAGLLRHCNQDQDTSSLH